MDQQERTWGMLSHLAAFVEFLGLPTLGNIIGPLIVWLIFRERHPFVDDQGRESINFQLSITIYALVLVAIIGLVGVLTFGIGLILLLPFIIAVAVLYYIAKVVLVIMASIAAYNGEPYRYPFTIRFF